MLIIVQNKFLTLKVDTLGAQMMELVSSQGTQYLWNGDPKYWRDRAPVLFPFVARLTNNSYMLYGQQYSMKIHGFAAASEFSVENKTSDSVTLLLVDNKQTREQYPYHFAFYITYELKDQSVLVTYRVENLDERELHFGIGGHPGFRVPLADGTGFEDYILRFSQACCPDRVGFTRELYLSGMDSSFPLEENRTLHLCHALFDEDAIVLKNIARSVTLCSEKTKAAITVCYPQMPYLGIWHAPKTNAPYVCIEPWVSLPSRQGVVEEFSCKSDLIHLSAGKTYENTWSITITDAANQ